MKTIHVVIGANYGDEGKGLFTDFIARHGGASRVIRFNGGAQAGHTVVDPDGERHVFSAYGSGTFATLSTSYTPEVIVNPYAIKTEADELLTKGVSYRLSLPKLCPVTTQYEVMINQLVEQSRGNNRHGSCGLGINETVERHNAMLAADPMLPQLLHDPRECEFAIKWIHETWLPKRLTDLGLVHTIEVAQARARKLGFLSHYQLAYRNMQRECLLNTTTGTNAPGYLNVQYEGAQGLALDEDRGTFPYVTRSTTGLPNVLKDLKRRLMHSGTPNEHIRLRVLYASRTYLTRHGRGPLPNEASVKEVLGSDFVDTTNVTNEWQEHLRFAPLDLCELTKRITGDLIRSQPYMDGLRNQIELLPCIGLTHMDIPSEYISIRTHEGVRVAATDALPHILEREFGFKVALASYGPTHKDVRVLDKNFIQEERVITDHQ